MIVDERIKQAFIDYLDDATDERFFQAITNFTQLPFIGFSHNQEGEEFKDLYYVDCDREINWVGKEYDNEQNI